MIFAQRLGGEAGEKLLAMQVHLLILGAAGTVSDGR